MESERVEISYMHWREKGGNEVVSTVLHESWDNATHPENHDEFTKTHMVGDEVPRFTPRERSEWETFTRSENPPGQRILDQKAHQQFIAEFADTVDYLNANEIIEFLNQSFEAEYTPNNNTFTRSFPWGDENTILRSDPTKRDKQLLQFTLNKMAEAAEKNDSFVSPREVLQLFKTYDKYDTEQLVETAMNKIKPALETKEIVVTNENDEEETKTVIPDSIVAEHREKLTKLATT